MRLPKSGGAPSPFTSTARLVYWRGMSQSITKRVIKTTMPRGMGADARAT
jgi:hypothetical protein